MNPTVYVETSIPSLLTAWPSRDTEIAGQQIVTRKWWKSRREDFELSVSPEVLEKMLNAELLRPGWPLEKTHDLDRLLDELVSRQSDLLTAIEPLCDALAEVCFSNRYPGCDLADPGWPFLREQIEGLVNLLSTVKGRVAAGGGCGG